MAQVQVDYSPTPVIEGGPGLSITVTLIEEPGDPVIPDHSVRWTIGEGSPSITESDVATGSFVTQGIALNFAGYGPANAQTFSEVLTLLDDGMVEAPENFTVTLDQLMGTNVSLAPGTSDLTTIQALDECFLAGTHLLTEQGYRPVEDLQIGDRVQAVEGKLEPIKWIGRQTRHRFMAHPQRSLPIQIKAGALGENRPRRDLFVSPDHAVLFEGVLINAGALENGVSIVKTFPDVYVYYHIELEKHSLLDAEGVPAESFYPNREDRATFDNGAEYDDLYPEGNQGLMLWPLDYPRISSKRALPLYISKKLMDIAHQLTEKEMNIRA